MNITESNATQLLLRALRRQCDGVGSLSLEEKQAAVLVADRSCKTLSAGDDGAAFLEKLTNKRVRHG